MNKLLLALTVAGALLAVGSLFNLTTTSTETTADVDAWTLWKQKYEKGYSTDSEESYRKGVFNQNLKFIAEHNAKNLGWTVGANMFADLTNDEFMTTYMGYNKSQNVSGASVKTFNVADAPDTKDWSTEGAVTGVKNQGACGSCWAFSATGGMEGSYFLKTGKLVSMSEQQLVDCSTTPQGNQGCNGGLPELAYAYVKTKGMESEADYSYRGVDQTCKYDSSKVISGSRVSSWSQVPKADSDQLKAAVASQPVSIGINAAGIGFQLYFGGVMNPWLCPANLDHGVLIVGYGTAKTIFGNDNPYWKVKNSWGSGWGEKGYFRIVRSSGKGVGKCGVTEDATLPEF